MTKGIDKATLANMAKCFDESERVFRTLRKGYASRKALAKSRVVEWQYSTRSLRSPIPLFDEVFGWPPGRPMKAKPAKMRNVFVSGIDAEGRVAVERRHTEFARQFYETFTDWAVNPVEIARYCEDEDKVPGSLTFLSYEGGRVVASWGCGQVGSHYSRYLWDGERCVQVEGYEASSKGAKRKPVELTSVDRATYDSNGALQRVARYFNFEDDDPEISYELRGGKPWWRRR